MSIVKYFNQSRSQLLLMHHYI